MALPSYPVDVTPPDITPYAAGNTGIPYVTRFDSLRPGPHVLINALTHGNELCGAVTLDYLFRQQIRPARGILTLSFANIDAYHAFDPEHPEQSRCVEEDFNRLWDIETLDGPRQSPDLHRARALRPVVDQADMLLDIHSMQHPTAPLCLCGTTQRARALAEALAIPDLIVIDQGHAAGRRMRDYAEFGREDGQKTALLIECGQHWQRSSCDIAIRATLRFLHHAGLIDADTATRLPDPQPDRPARSVEVTDAITVTHPEFRFARPFVGMEVIARAGTLIAQDGTRPVVTPYDDCVLIMPSRRLSPGQTAVRLGRFLR